MKIKETNAVVQELWGKVGHIISERIPLHTKGYGHMVEKQYLLLLDEPLREVGPGIKDKIWLEFKYLEV